MTKLAAAAVGFVLLILVGSASPSATRARLTTTAQSWTRLSTVTGERIVPMPALSTAEIERSAKRSIAPASRPAISAGTSAAVRNTLPAARPSASADPACGRLALSPGQPGCALPGTQ